MGVKYQDYYQVLGVPRTASQDEIQRAYRKLARKYHPDVNKDKAAEPRFRELTEAYEVLKDPEKRKRFDALGADWKAGQDFRPPPGWEHAGGRRARQGPRAAGASRGQSQQFDFDDLGGFSDFFESIFGGAGSAGFGSSPFGAGAPGEARTGRRPPRQRQGQTHEVEIEIPLADAYLGATRRVSLDVVETGEDGEAKHTTRSYDVRVPAGTTDGSVIRLAGQGGPGMNGSQPGDLLLKVRIAPDPRFQVSGHDLTTIVPIAPWEAALGAKVEVALLGGGAVVTIPPGSQSGQRLRLRGKGLPKRSGDGPGDVLVELRIAVPKNISDEERRLYQQLADVSNFDPRRA
jgi:curved DNA-binding protein